jgi:hypothetical protein
VIGFHERERLRGLGVVQHEVEVCAVAWIGGIKLRSKVIVKRPGQAVQPRPGFEHQAPPRLVLRAALRERLKRSLHHADALAHRQ